MHAYRSNLRSITAVDMLQYSQHLGAQPQTPTPVIAYSVNVEPPPEKPWLRTSIPPLKFTSAHLNMVLQHHIILNHIRINITTLRINPTINLITHAT